jgi:large subunit ribosomal protein L16
MGIQPKKVKFRKDHRGRRRGVATRGNTALEACWLKTNQIESARKAVMHFVKRGGKLWIRVLADKSATARPAETRMGGGKGDPAYYVAVVRPGKIIFELAGVSKEDALEAMRLAGHKLPIKTRLVEKV